MSKLLEGLDRSTRDAVERRITHRTYVAGEEIVFYQEVEADLYFMIEGEARVKIFSQSGRVVDYRTLVPGDMFGELALIDSSPRSASVIAQTDCLLGHMTEEAFWELNATAPMFNRAVLVHLTGLIRALTDRVLEYSTHSGSQRVYLEIMRMAEEAGIHANSAEIPAPPTHQVLADRISFHREAVSREMSRLTRMGLLKREKGVLHVRDVEALVLMTSNATEK